MSFCCSLAWLDSILRWCVQFQAQMNLPAQVHLRKDVGRDWSSGIPGWRELLQSDWEQFSFLFFFSLSLSFFYIKTHFLNLQTKETWVFFLFLVLVSPFTHCLDNCGSEDWLCNQTLGVNESTFVSVALHHNPTGSNEQPEKKTTMWLNIIQPERETKKI